MTRALSRTHRPGRVDLSPGLWLILAAVVAWLIVLTAWWAFGAVVASMGGGAL